MKPKTITGISRHPEGLTFAWLRGDESLVRFWVALVLASLIFIGAWLGIRVMVPVAMTPDRPRVEKAQLLLMNAKNDPGLLALMTSQRLPSLGVQESVGDAPLVEDILRQLSLSEEVEEEVYLYPAPEVTPTLAWPQEGEMVLAFPELPSPRKQDWPKWGDGPAARWSLEIAAAGSRGKILEGASFFWEGAAPVEKSFTWWLVFDDWGELSSALAVGILEEGVEAEMRKQLVLFFSKADLDLRLALGSFVGEVELRFKKEE